MIFFYYLKKYRFKFYLCKCILCDQLLFCFFRSKSRMYFNEAMSFCSYDSKAQVNSHLLRAHEIQIIVDNEPSFGSSDWGNVIILFAHYETQLYCNNFLKMCKIYQPSLYPPTQSQPTPKNATFFFSNSNPNK